MNTDIFHKINGYLEGLSRINTHFGVCYGHQYLFSEVDSALDEAAARYNETSNLSRHDDIRYLPPSALDDWQSALFELSANWFFFLFRMQNLQVNVVHYDKAGNELPPVQAELDRRYNEVSNRLIELLEQFIGDREVRVFKMMTEVEHKDEFDWEQLYFEIDGRVFVLEFYQHG